MPNIVKNTTFINLLDLVAPHSCRGCGRLGEPLCDCCKNYLSARSVCLCPICKTKNKNGKCQKHPDLPPVFNLGKRDGLLDDLVHEYKYNSIRAFAPKLAELISAKIPILPENTIIVPLPTATNHIRTRGFDHTLKLARHLAKLKHCKVKSLLIRTKNTVQVGADQKTRLLQAEQAFTINPRITINPDATYLVFDDVWTTGASIKSAIKKLQQAGAKHFIIVLLAVSSLD